MKLVFTLVVYVLKLIAKKTSLSYNEINIIVYYFIIPFSWLCLLDIIFHFHYLKIAYLIFILGFLVGCGNFKEYSNWLFFKSVKFLNYFNRFGSNYVASSVWICIAVPVLIYSILTYFVLK